MKPRRRMAAAVVLLWLLFAQLLWAATSLSATIDEGFHITSGYEYLRTGRLQLFDEHTPLSKALFAWPLFFVPDLTPPEQAAGYAEGNLISAAQETVLAYRPLDRVIVACRVPVALLTLLLAASVLRWATHLGGSRAGLLSLALFAFDPNLLAHGSLATTDMGATAFILWSTLALAEYLRRPTRRGWWAASLILGLALGTKLTALMLLPVNGLLWLAGTWEQPHTLREAFRHLLHIVLRYAGMVGVALLVLWALYGFEIRTLPQIAGGTLPLPAASHIERWLRLQSTLAGGRETFLLGRNGTHGWWYYFPVAFALKTPLMTIGLLAIALVWGTWQIANCELRITNYELRITDSPVASNQQPATSSQQPSNIQHPPPHTPTPPRPHAPLLLFPILYAIAALFSTFNIGYRHLLPVLPFIYAGITRITNYELRITDSPATSDHPTSNIQHPTSRFTHHALRLILPLLLLLHCAKTLLAGPHYLTYFNGIVDTAGGWRYLADSNSDWGQAYKALAAYQTGHDLGEIKLAAFVFYDPAAYGVTYTALPPMPLEGLDVPAIFPSRLAPPPGDYVIGASVLDGIPLADPEMYDWFRWREADSIIAGALHYYHVTPDETETHWVAQCITPTAPLDATALTEGFGQTGTRTIAFDCTQSWIMPTGGAEPGSYVLHGELFESDLDARLHLAAPDTRDAFIRRRLETAHPAYHQWQYHREPAFGVYRTGQAPLEPDLRAVRAAPAESTPAQLASQPLEQAPQPLDGALTYLGAGVTPDTDGLDIETWWQVDRDPQGRPVSIFAHLLAADGAALAGADGMGVPVEFWQRGDVIVQRHHFTLSPEQRAAAVMLRTGVYTLDGGARHAVTSGPPGADALFVELEK